MYYSWRPLLLLAHVCLSWALPLVDPGLFVIMGVSTCRSGEGYCLLGQDCTLDEDFLPDDQQGHCDGLRSAFTPSAHFICCRYNNLNATSNSSTTTTPSTVSLVTPYLRDRPADGALVDILKDYLDTNSEPFVPIKPELVANNHLPISHEDIEIVAEPIQTSPDTISIKDEQVLNKNHELVKISDPIDIEKIKNNRPIIPAHEERIKIPEVIRGEPILNIKDVPVIQDPQRIKDGVVLSSVEDDHVLKPVANPPADVITGHRPRPEPPVVKGQITRVGGHHHHHHHHHHHNNRDDGDIQEAVLEAMIPVKIVDVNSHGASKNVNIRRTSGSPAVTVTVADSPHLQKINLIPKSLWR